MKRGIKGMYDEKEKNTKSTKKWKFEPCSYYYERDSVCLNQYGYPRVWCCGRRSECTDPYNNRQYWRY